MRSEGQPIGFEDIRKDDFVFLVVGAPGAGRSTFIAQLTGFDTDILRSSPAGLHEIHTTQTVFVRFSFQGRNVVVVDTPGYDNYDKRGSIIILCFVERLKGAIGKGPDGVVYVQKAMNRQHLKAQALLTGSHLIPKAKTHHSGLPKNPPFLPPVGRVLVVTTHWHEVDDDHVLPLQKALTKEFTGLMKRGAAMMAFQAAGAPDPPGFMPRADTLSTSGLLESRVASSASSSRTQLVMQSRVGSEEELPSEPLPVDWTLRGATDIASLLFDDELWPRLRAYEDHIRLESEVLSQDGAPEGRTGGCGCWKSFLSLFK